MCHDLLAAKQCLDIHAHCSQMIVFLMWQPKFPYHSQPITDASQLASSLCIIIAPLRLLRSSTLSKVSGTFSKDLMDKYMKGVVLISLSSCYMEMQCTVYQQLCFMVVSHSNYLTYVIILNKAFFYKAQHIHGTR